ncbi:sulfate/molybdate ABC transporter ATP-binding protein [Nocardioides sp.]|uniref:sulfate/molybdate ABC transporter ATP-binding protein n=1 Tax=Nocardioides sp. TaxID=35761 RepID=UPI003568B776
MSLELDVSILQRGVEAGLRVATGTTVAILGPNGAGKSTLLDVAAGLLRPDRGRVVLGGRTLTSIGDGPEIQVRPHARRTASLGQEPLLFPHLSVLDNVGFAARRRGSTRKQARAAAARWLAEVGVGDLAGRRPRELSGGQAQRVAVARALAAEPQLLLLDEPMAALDVDVRPELRQTLRRVLAGRTAVVVTHDVLDALLLADRVVVVEGGRVVEQGPAAEVLSRPRSPFAARLAGLNLVTGTWTGEQVAGEDGVGEDVAGEDGVAVHGLVVGAPPRVGDRVVATFRPHAVAVYRDEAGGSPRNRIRVRVTALEPQGDLIRVRAGSLAADITAPALAELGLAVGQRVIFSVKATEVAVYPLAAATAGTA